MAFSIPSLEDIAQRTRQAFATHLPGADTSLWPSNVYVAAKVIAGRIWELFHRLDYIGDQAFPLTATGVYLDRHSQVYGIVRKEATEATGTAIMTGATPLTVIPAGTVLQRSDGAEFLTMEAAWVGELGSVTLNLVASATGHDGNTDGGETLSVTAAIAGAATTAQVSSIGLSGGAEIETDDDLRARLIQRLKFPPHAGSEADYMRWATAIPGVTRVWVQSAAYGPGTVGLWFTMDDTYEDGIPTQADIDAVQAYVDSVKPITANVTVMAPAREPLMVEVTGIEPFTAGVIASIKSELKAVIADRANVSTVSVPQYFRRSWVWQAVSNATGERYHTVALPQDDYLIPAGAIPVYDETFIRLSQ